MKARRLTAQQFVPLIQRFWTEHGAEQMKASYDWDRPSTRMYPGERVWAFDTESGVVPPATEIVVGWGSMHFNTRDAEEGDAALLVGVFPYAQRHGYRVQILDYMAAKAKSLGATTASMIVYKANGTHYQRIMREAHTEGNPWTYAGDVWYPAPGYGMFVRSL